MIMTNSFLIRALTITLCLELRASMIMATTTECKYLKIYFSTICVFYSGQDLKSRLASDNAYSLILNIFCEAVCLLLVYLISPLRDFFLSSLILTMLTWSVSFEPGNKFLNFSWSYINIIVWGIFGKCWKNPQITSQNPLWKSSHSLKNLVKKIEYMSKL